jgi:hypothetical protein
VSKKSPKLPNIEDASLRAFLAPLMEAMETDSAMKGIAEPRFGRPDFDVPAPSWPGIPISSTDDASHAGDGPAAATVRPEDPGDDDVGTLRTVERFLAMTEAELARAAASFPKQINGTLSRVHRLKRRLAEQYDAATTVATLLERALGAAIASPAFGGVEPRSGSTPGAKRRG